MDNIWSNGDLWPSYQHLQQERSQTAHLDKAARATSFGTISLQSVQPVPSCPLPIHVTLSSEGLES